MGHDNHFLERLDRSRTEQVDLALSPYRDEELVRYLVARAALGAGESRFAVSLGTAKRGPYLVLALPFRFRRTTSNGRAPGEG